jgi:GAF domain-containing protein
MLSRRSASHIGAQRAGLHRGVPAEATTPVHGPGSEAVFVNDIPRPDSDAEALEQLGRMALREQSMESVLQTVVELAKRVLPGNPEASISLLVNGRPSTTSSTGKLATDMDETQYGRGYGPCLESASTGELIEIPDTATEQRWADYCRIAVERGNRSSLSVPLPVSERVSGALNVYARAPHVFDERAKSAALRFAPYASVAVANMHAYQDARDMAGNLQVALESRAVIDQAKGILMERHRLSADQAFQALAAVSMRSNRKVREIAEQLVETGEFDEGASGLV